jgi:hypothetical protein
VRSRIHEAKESQPRRLRFCDRMIESHAEVPFQRERFDCPGTTLP